MTIKKYLKTIEDIEALRNTDTKIHCEGSNSYWKFVNGVLCRFGLEGIVKDTLITYGSGITLNGYVYIEAEERVKEVTEEDIGKLCWFWDFHDDDKQTGVLVTIAEDSCPYRNKYTWYQHCRRLTPEEVAEITGYKVEA